MTVLVTSREELEAAVVLPVLGSPQRTSITIGQTTEQAKTLARATPRV